MGSAVPYLSCIFIMAVFVGVYATNCSQAVSSGCVRCDTTGLRCIKCRHVMDEYTRMCKTACGSGQKEAWSTKSATIGRICLEAGLWTSLGLSGQGAAVVVGCLVGVALSFAAVLGGVIYMRRRAKAQLLTHDDSSDSTLTVTPLNHQDRTEFLTWLSGLRKEAPTFLSMLNETRTQARSATTVQPYKPVLRDLLTLLLLLNTPEPRILTPPPDWRRLLAWAERVLRRYKRQSHHTGGGGEAVGELVSFLPYNTMSTASTNTLQSRNKDWSTESDGGKDWSKNWPSWNNNQRRTSILDNDDGLNDPSPVVAPHNLNKFSISEAQLSPTAWDHVPNELPLWSVPSREVLHEDDYGQLGFRPQDEITTEL